MSEQNDETQSDETAADAAGDGEPVDHIGTAAVKGDVEGVATQEQNDALEHTEGGSTTRDDANDLGVPMVPGSPDEPQGPEDALGLGPTRGDYTDRIGPSSYHPHESRMTKDEDGNDVQVMEAQRPRTEDIGDVPGKKGGVETEGETAA